MSILTTCRICDKVIFIRAEIMGPTQCCQRVTHITDMFTKSYQGTIAQRCLSRKTVLPIMFLVMPSESHVWTLVDRSLAIPFSSDTIDTLIPAILLYGSYKITHFLIKHFFLRATGIGWLRGNDQRWTSIPSRGSRNTPSRFMLQNPGISSSSYDPAGSKASFFFYHKIVSVFHLSASLTSASSLNKTVVECPEGSSLSFLQGSRQPPIPSRSETFVQFQKVHSIIHLVIWALQHSFTNTFLEFDQLLHRTCRLVCKLIIFDLCS